MAVHRARKKYPYPHLPPPSVVSLDCSSVKSFYRRNLSHSKSSTDTITSPTSLHSPIFLTNGRTAAQDCHQRARQRELELIQLDKWISAVKNRRDCIRSRSKVDMGRLPKGGFLYGNKVTGKLAGRLAIQISEPAIIPVEIGSNISQVLHRMAAMGKESLRKWLLESLPVDEIRSKELENIKYAQKREGFMEDIIFAAMGKMEILVLEGLKLQLDTKMKKEINHGLDNRKERDKDCIFVVIRIQARDPDRDYEAVQDFMICFVEVTVAEGEENGFCIEGIHVAGMSTGIYEDKYGFKTPTSNCEKVLGVEGHLWSFSPKNCEGRCCHCWGIVRHPNVGFV